MVLVSNETMSTTKKQALVASTLKLTIERQRLSPETNAARALVE
jgi:hypothetical protein